MTTPEVKKIYSTDQKLYVGMTQDEAYKQEDANVIKLFNYADINKDKVIDEKEMLRYNGPIIVENKETDKERIVGAFNSALIGGSISLNVIQDNTREYYPGLTVEQTKDENDYVERFREIDNAPCDGVLSENEIKDTLLKKKNQLSDKLKKIKRTDNIISAGFGVVGTVVAGMMIVPAAATIAGGIALTTLAGGAIYGLARGTLAFFDSWDRHELKGEIQEIDNALTDNEK
ncbi:MAG: hypothetical protein MJ231_05290 [bacterium]|nr:hypothetical protein [bacterium]